MNPFWSIVGSLALLSLAILAVPLWRGRALTKSSAAAASSAPITALLLFAALGGVPPERNDSELLQLLTAHVHEHPEDVDSWEQLGKAYFSLGLYGESTAAYEESWSRTPEPSIALKLAYAEASLLSQRDTVTGLAGELIEQVLSDDPENSRALMYGGLAAELRGDNEIARERWQRLMEQEPPEQIAGIVRERLKALEPAAVAGDSTVGQEAE